MTSGAKYIGNDRKEYEIMVKKEYERVGNDQLNLKWWIIEELVLIN